MVSVAYGQGRIEGVSYRTGLRTRSIFNRVPEIFASSSSKNFIF